MTIDPSDFYTVVEGKETVQYQVWLGPNGPGLFDTAVPVPNAKYLTLEKIDELSDASLYSKSALWFFWKANLGSITPKNNDRFTDVDGSVWRIDTVRTFAFKTAFRAVCIKVL